MRVRISSSLLMAVSIGALSASQALAQSTSSAMASRQAEGRAAQAEATILDDVVVTATRRSTTLQKTPVSMTAVTGETLQQIGATGMQDYFRQIPSANFTQGPLGQTRVSFRGIRSAGESTVGLFYDETPVTGPAGTTQDPSNNSVDLNLFDVSRVEALRGPQGTLFGSGSLGGTLRILFNPPDAKRFEGATELQASTVRGGDAGYFAKGMVNIPIVTDRLAIRAVGYTERRPGYIDNVRYGTADINHGKNQGLRALLAFTPLDNFSVTLTAINQTSDAPDAQGWFETLGRAKTNSTIKQIYNNKFQLYSAATRWESPIGDLVINNAHYTFDITRSFESTAAVLTLSKLPALCPMFIGAARACTATELAAYAAYGVSRAPAGGYQFLSLSTWTHEARLSSRSNGPVQYTIGAFYEDRSDDVDSRVVLASSTNGALDPNNITGRRSVGTDTRQFSQFGELSLKPLAALTLTAGARHYDYTKTTSGAVITPNPVVGLLPAVPSTVEAQQDGWIKKLNVSYQATPALLAYATYSEGFRPGGANNVQGLSSAFTVYDADDLKNYELGAKFTGLGGRLTLAGSLYRADWDNLQTSATTANGLFGFIVNAGAARVEGGEVEVAYRPAQGLSLSGSYAHTNARLVEDQTATGVTASGSTGRAGDRLPGVPRETASLAATYYRDIGHGLAGVGRLDATYTGPQQSEFRGPNLETLQGFTSVNMRVGVQAESWSATVFVQNLTDSTGVSTAYSTLGIDRQVFSITPRTIGLNVTTRFGD